MTHSTMPDLSFLTMMRSGLMNASDHTEFVTNLAAQYGDIVRFSIFGRKYILISHPDYIREVLVTKSKFFPKDQRDIDILSRAIGRGLVTTNGATHKTQRKLAQPSFHAQRIQNYADTMVDYTHQTIENWQNGEVRDVSQEMMELTMFIVCKTLFDVDREKMSSKAHQAGESIHILQGIVDKEFNAILNLPPWLPTRHNRTRKRERAALDKIIDGTIIERRDGKSSEQIQDRGDLLSMLMLAEDEEGNRLSEPELRDQLITLFAAGHETTSNALTWTWHLLAQHPVVAERLHAELDQVLNGRLPTLHDLSSLPYTEMVLKESMRLYPPVWALNTRVATKETTIDDYSIPKGSRIWISPYVMHHHPRYFSEPNRFLPERFAPENARDIPRYAYLPFGAGPRVCIGNSFAMMEAQLILATIAQKFTFEPVDHQPVRKLPQITMSPKGGMKMRLVAPQGKIHSGEEATHLSTEPPHGHVEESTPGLVIA